MLSRLKQKRVLIILILTLVLFLLSLSLFSPKEEVFGQVYEDSIKDLEAQLPQNEAFEITDSQIEGEWAIAEVFAVNETTGKTVVGEGIIIIFHKEGSEWKAALPGTQIYNDWLDKIPETLIPYDLKEFIR